MILALGFQLIKRTGQNVGKPRPLFISAVSSVTLTLFTGATTCHNDMRYHIVQCTTVL